ncbi:hypothetical protein C5167_018605 [Papaver somniferum]|uniref:Reverse transcriptase zinc-binding domain-containing protein n=1 Tax=Papaver somniferum TaxID=3469 RepID=A0A4Y7IR52_PAPSO|nr:hypothetical protein C5167_018605 [Papaver somniferum]
METNLGAKKGGTKDKNFYMEGYPQWTRCTEKIGRYVTEIPTECVICENEAETVHHLLFKCPFAHAVWFASPMGLRLQENTQENLIHLLESWLTNGDNEKRWGSRSSVKNTTLNLNLFLRYGFHESTSDLSIIRRIYTNDFQIVMAALLIAWVKDILNSGLWFHLWIICVCRNRLVEHGCLLVRKFFFHNDPNFCRLGKRRCPWMQEIAFQFQSYTRWTEHCLKCLASLSHPRACCTMKIYKGKDSSPQIWEYVAPVTGHCMVIMLLQGVMKRHGMEGGVISHGSSKFHRGCGSIGQSDAPGKVNQKFVVSLADPEEYSTLFEKHEEQGTREEEAVEVEDDSTDMSNKS